MKSTKPPVMFSPRWFWQTTMCTATVVTPTFWKRWATPEHQATWNVSSWVTIAQIACGAAAWKWAEVNAPWVIKLVLAVGATIKAVLVFFATLAVAAWNVVSP